MPTIKFPFARVPKKDPKLDPLGRHSILRPLIPVRLHGKPGFYIDAWALVDTGSDDTIFDAELADSVGIAWETGDSYEISGIDGGKIRVHFKDSFYEVGGHKFSAALGFAKMPIYKAILGQCGFFDKTITTFDPGNNRIEIKF